MIGQSIGRYHVLEKLGEGGMATVYRAFDTRLDRDVALKVIQPIRQQSPEFLKRFEREAKALAQLAHPNIVSIHDYGEQDGMPYLVMEYTPGGTLKQSLGELMPWPQACRLLAPIARALHYAHQQKIVHRDIKPSNILITASGDPKLSDFGIAKILEAEKTWDLTGTGVGIGTPEYMAPEQGMGKAVDHRADIYALGIVLFELVTGRTPFKADTPLAVLLKQVNDPLPRPREFAKDLPKAVEQVIFKALAKSPDDRFQDMDSFAESLERLAAEGAKVGGAPYLPNARRRRLIVVLGLVAGASVFLAAGLFLRGVLPGRSAQQQRSLPGNTDQPSRLPETPTMALAATPMQIVESNTGQVSTQSIATSISVEDPSVYDDFGDSEFDGAFNTGNWDLERSDNILVEQQGGSLVIRAAKVTNRVTNSWLTMKLPENIKLTGSTAFLEARMMISGDHQGNYMNVTIKMNAYPGGDVWWSQCGLAALGTGAPQVLCDVTNFTRDRQPEFQPIVPIQYDKWYVVRMEIVPDDFEVSFYLDGRLIGRGVPSDSERLRLVGFSRTVDSWVDANTSMTAYVDYVKTAP